MELLDNDEKQGNPRGQMLGSIGGIFYAIAGLACIVGIYSSGEAIYALVTTGNAESAFVFKSGFLTIYAVLIADFAFIFALIFQRRAFFRYKYSPMWLWWFILVSSICALLSWIWPTNPFAALVALGNFYHLYKRRKVYREFEEN
jgi:magnesium-transporting ATPase (P-type)